MPNKDKLIMELTSYFRKAKNIKKASIVSKSRICHNKEWLKAQKEYNRAI